MTELQSYRRDTEIVFVMEVCTRSSGYIEGTTCWHNTAALVVFQLLSKTPVFFDNTKFKFLSNIYNIFKKLKNSVYT